ncbi:TetR/AcrR family transcriptional regulator [Lachnoclostridium phytofermentans]|uniref:Putative transcriptional regulator, TetR family n=1 Tax=Lachnoclostridium phytofermentans (strain ATCC 700394 / DSM 18823 / ISDg) TaxID=357809 RepID=A9KSA2_LACP7|nr:TetR family transcriptional regulator [Lachnoclostridium phytofermentans]ABX42134.1 putative transcriptional regulator, TetR family [Lachnoclostridium phytofermentans ISDg]
MPPQKKISKEDIEEAAFLIAKEEGFSGITARNVAKHLGCSVAPIYVNFTTIDVLIEAVIVRVFAISDELLAKQKGQYAFENVGKASLAFAREYPVFFRELIMQPNPYMDSYDAVEKKILEQLAEAESMSGWTLEERRNLLLRMRIFQTGLSVMIANGHIPSWLDDKAVEAVLFETGRDLLCIQKMKREGNIKNE